MSPDYRPPAGSEPTDRELTVLEAYLDAGSARGAADRLGLSRETVKGHLANLRSRCRVRTTAQVVYVLRDRLP